MTKLRPPVSFERAIVRIADRLGYEAMAKLIHREPRTVRDYSDPDVPTSVSLSDACLLELAYRQAGGEGYPISDCFRLRVRLGEGLRADDDQALFDGTLVFLKENGEAGVALVAAARPGATAVDRAIARREVEQAVNAGTDALRLLTEPPAPP